MPLVWPSVNHGAWLLALCFALLGHSRLSDLRLSSATRCDRVLQRVDIGSLPIRQNPYIPKDPMRPCEMWGEPKLTLVPRQTS